MTLFEGVANFSFPFLLMQSKQEICCIKQYISTYLESSFSKEFNKVFKVNSISATMYNKCNAIL